MNKILKIEEKAPVAATLPDGYYTGILGGNNIDVIFEKKSYQLTTKEGWRGIGMRVVVIIKNGEATYEFLKN